MTERLEEMNKKVVGLIDGEDFSDLVQMDVDTYAWFYEQAERAEKNAQDLEDMDRQLYREQQQIKRYREALEEISQKRMAYADMAGVLRIARKALEDGNSD